VAMYHSFLVSELFFGFGGRALLMTSLGDRCANRALGIRIWPLASESGPKTGGICLYYLEMAFEYFPFTCIITSIRRTDLPLLSFSDPLFVIYQNW